MTEQDVERREFEKWLLEVHGLDSEWQPERNCYKDFPIHLAWKAYQHGKTIAALPNKHEKALGVLKEIAKKAADYLEQLYGTGIPYAGVASNELRTAISAVDEIVGNAKPELSEDAVKRGSFSDEDAGPWVTGKNDLFKVMDGTLSRLKRGE